MARCLTVECRSTDLYFFNRKLTTEHPHLWDIRDPQLAVPQLPVRKTAAIPALFIVRAF